MYPIPSHTHSFWGTVCKTVRPMLSVSCLSSLSVCLSVCLSVTFVHCGQTVERIKMKLGMQVGLGPGHIVLDGDPAPGSPTPKGHSPPYFRTNICCSQMAAWIKMPLGMELGVGPGDFVLDWDPAPPTQGGGAEPPPQIFGPCLLWLNGWMDEAGSWRGGRYQPRRLCVRWGPSPLLRKGAEPPPQFSAHFYCGQTDGCIKMPLGMDVGLSPVDFVLDGDPVPKRVLDMETQSPPQKGGGALQIFGPCLLWPNGWMD